jgi:hypothetical protein
MVDGEDPLATTVGVPAEMVVVIALTGPAAIV